MTTLIQCPKCGDPFAEEDLDTHSGAEQLELVCPGCDTRFTQGSAEVLFEARQCSDCGVLWDAYEDGDRCPECGGLSYDDEDDEDDDDGDDGDGDVFTEEESWA